MQDKRVLIVEDDRKISAFIGYSLQKEAFEVVLCSGIHTAMEHLVSHTIDLVILDLGLPDGDGSELIQFIRQWSFLPIIVVSAREQDSEKVKVLDMGADDYLTKPFSANELMARVRVALRHQSVSQPQEVTKEYEVGELRLDLESHLVYLSNQEVHVTPLEFDLLALLFKHQGKILTTRYIMKEIYHGYYGQDTQALRALMSSLRHKIEITPAKPRYIVTEVGVGYRLVSE